MISKRLASLIILGTQLLLLGGVAAKYNWDLRTQPHMWLKAVPVDPESLTRGRYLLLRVQPPNALQPQVLPLYIPEHAQDPTHTPDLYVEVTVPSSGQLRAIRLGTLRDGVYAPLDRR